MRCNFTSALNSNWTFVRCYYKLFRCLSKRWGTGITEITIDRRFERFCAFHLPKYLIELRVFALLELLNGARLGSTIARLHATTTTAKQTSQQSERERRRSKPKLRKLQHSTVRGKWPGGFSWLVVALHSRAVIILYQSGESAMAWAHNMKTTWNQLHVQQSVCAMDAVVSEIVRFMRSESGKMEGNDTRRVVRFENLKLVFFAKSSRAWWGVKMCELLEIRNSWNSNSHEIFTDCRTTKNIRHNMNFNFYFHPKNERKIVWLLPTSNQNKMKKIRTSIDRFCVSLNSEDENNKLLKITFLLFACFMGFLYVFRFQISSHLSCWRVQNRSYRETLLTHLALLVFLAFFRIFLLSCWLFFSYLFT